MVYVRRVIAVLLIVIGLVFVSLLFREWNRVDSHGNRVVFGYASLMATFVGSGIALLWPIKQPLPSSKARAGVYVRRVLAIFFIAAALTFALRIPGNWGRKNKRGGSLVTSDVVMVVLFGGLTAAVLVPTRREKPSTDAATS